MSPPNMPRLLRDGVRPSHTTLQYLRTNEITSAAGLERPTPRAVSERISKIREKAKASGTATHFSVPSASSNPSTPRKKSTNRVTKKPAPKKTNGTKGSASKRKRAERISDEYVSPSPTHFVPTSSTNNRSDDSEATTFESSNNASDASDEETPQKKPKLNAKGKGKSKDLVKVKAEEEENGMYDSDGTVGGNNVVNHVDDYA